MVKSNINIASNIYVRSNSDIRKDRKYVGKITGAKLLKDIKNRYIGFEAIPLTQVQEKIISENQRCFNAHSGEMSYGAVLKDGELFWECRCEYTDCPGVYGCTPKKIERETVDAEDAEEDNSLQEFLEKHGIIIENNTVVSIKELNEAEDEFTPKEYSAPKELSAVELQQTSRLYTEITEPDCIISAPFGSHIILNSGPGTGKTYTIIRRLIYILKNDLCPAEEIYVLCYTRSAKELVLSRINEAVVNGEIKPSAKNICVLTFDSYATYFLIDMKEQGVITENFDSYGYDERIKLFNKYASAEDFEGISYFVVDELQDLVNERAEMVLKILENVNCGYLLAGDRCQSIYDYSADKEAKIDSVEFYKRAEVLFPNDILRYEITVNNRQTPKLADEAEKMRKVLLNENNSEQNKYASEIGNKYLNPSKIEQYIKNLSQTPAVSTAILCRSNGEAEYISGLLCKKGIKHSLNRGVNNANPLPRWIADVFWDYCNETINKEDFKERFMFRSDFKVDPDFLWNKLCEMTGAQDNAVILNVFDLIKALSKPDNIPNEFYGEAPLLTVSTIHKAKGKEFENVILIPSYIKPSPVSAEEARVRYVALTRPKKQFYIMKKNIKNFGSIHSQRAFEILRHYNNRYCKSIAVGLTGDIDSSSFVSGGFDDALDLQEYIAGNVKLYDKLSAKRSPSTGYFEIYHNDRCIGLFSKTIINELSQAISMTNYNSRLPIGLENIYVSEITTEILKKFNDNVPIEFQKSRICFGIQVTGLAQLVFEKK